MQNHRASSTLSLEFRMWSIPKILDSRIKREERIFVRHGFKEVIEFIRILRMFEYLICTDTNFPIHEKKLAYRKISWRALSKNFQEFFMEEGEKEGLRPSSGGCNEINEGAQGVGVV